MKRKVFNVIVNGTFVGTSNAYNSGLRKGEAFIRQNAHRSASYTRGHLDRDTMEGFKVYTDEAGKEWRIEVAQVKSNPRGRDSKLLRVALQPLRAKKSRKVKRNPSVRTWDVTFKDGTRAKVKASTHKKAQSHARLLNHSGIVDLVLQTNSRWERQK